MELVSKKTLAIICSLFMAVAFAEGFWIYRNQVSRAHYHSLDCDFSHPFAFAQKHFAPWDLVPSRFFPKNQMRDWDDDSFFKSKFPNGNFVEESFALNEPKRNDKGDQVNLTFDIQGHEKGNFDVKVSGHQITLVGRDDQDQAQDESKNESHWRKTQSFPLPEDVDPKHYTIERSDSKLVVSFKKLG